MLGGQIVRSKLECEFASVILPDLLQVSTLKRLHCDMGVVRGNASMDDYFRSLRRTDL